MSQPKSMNGPISLRAATPADAVLLRHWDEQPHVVAANPNDSWNWEVDLAITADWQEQWIAELNGRPIGFIEIIDPAREESCYWGNVPANLRAIDIWIGEASDLGKGYGTTMIQLALGRCFASPDVTAVLVDPLASNTRAHRFYERQGFKFSEHRQFGDDACLVYRLERTDWAKCQAIAARAKALPAQRVIPTLRIMQYHRSKVFYLDGLGFKLEWEHRFEPHFPVFMSVVREGMRLYLSEHTGDCQVGSLVYFVVADVGMWYQEFLQRGVTVTEPPHHDLGFAQMTITDPDGNQLRFMEPSQNTPAA